jgi:hypothetical protein
MVSTFPSAWLLLALPFASAGVIAHARPLRHLSASHHRVTWTVGVVGLCAFLAGLFGLVPARWTLAVVLLGGAVAGFSCFWTRRTDDGGEDWRRPSPPPDDDPPPPGLPDIPIDWQKFDRLRSEWARAPRSAAKGPPLTQSRT